jgi:hypothetical protein
MIFISERRLERQVSKFQSFKVSCYRKRQLSGASLLRKEKSPAKASDRKL